DDVGVQARGMNRGDVVQEDSASVEEENLGRAGGTAQGGDEGTRGEEQGFQDEGEDGQDEQCRQRREGSLRSHRKDDQRGGYVREADLAAARIAVSRRNGRVHLLQRVCRRQCCGEEQPRRSNRYRIED